MNHICLTITQLDKQPSLLSQIVANAREHRRRWQIVRHENESDRLDRLRNPTKFLGSDVRYSAMGRQT